MHTETALIPRQTLSQMSEAWQQSEQDISTACGLLSSAVERLQSAFGGHSFDCDIRTRGRDIGTDPKLLLKQFKKDAWMALLDRMEIRNLMSLAEIQEMDKQLEDGEGMPEITAQNLIAMLDGTMNRVPSMIQDLVKEVYDYLRPNSTRFDYKTNIKNEAAIKNKVIIRWAVAADYGSHWTVNYHRRDNLYAIDRVFHALDGKGIPKTHGGQLCDAIYALSRSETVGETEYFRFKCFHNHNLHLEFKRQDLLDKFNAAAGGMRLANHV